MEISRTSLLFFKNMIVFACLIVATHAVFSEYLAPRSRCLGNCLFCDFDVLELCHQPECQEGYGGEECLLGVGMHSSVDLMQQHWANSEKTICTYTSPSGENRIQTLGLYEEVYENNVEVMMNGGYKFMILSFNLMRTSWSPYSDVLRVQVQGGGERLAQFIIDLERRQEIDEEVNLVRCGGQTIITEKYIKTIPLGVFVNKLSVSFEGYMFSDAKWGLANAKITLGCADFVHGEGYQCLQCVVGFYPTEYRCQRCPIQCASCVSTTQCSQCAVNSSSLPACHLPSTILPAQHTTQVCGHELALSSGGMIVQQYVLHTQSQVIVMVDVYYEVEGEIQIQINGQSQSILLPSPDIVSHCLQFPFGIEKVATQPTYQNHNMLTLMIKSQNIGQFGISEVYLLTSGSSPTLYNNTKVEQEQKPYQKQEQGQSEDKEDKEENGEKGNKEEKQDQWQIQQLLKQIPDIQYQLNIVQDGIYIKITYPKRVLNVSILSILGTVPIEPTLILSAHKYQIYKIPPQGSFLNTTLTIMAYEHSPRRTLQALSTSQMVQLTSMHIVRYDYLDIDDKNTIMTFNKLLQVVCWCTIILTIILSSIGKAAIMVQMYIVLHTIFLHVYIYSQYLPQSLKLGLSGLEKIQNMGLLENEWVENWLFGTMQQDTPLRYLQFNTDINFTRAVYPIMLVNLLLAVVFIVVKVVGWKVKPMLEGDGGWKEGVGLLVVQAGQRNLNYWYQIIQYQTPMIMWAAFLQFFNPFYPPDADTSWVPNFVFCLLLVLLLLFIPILVVRHTSHNYLSLDYSQYYYWYGDIFYGQLPTETLPSRHHRVYLLIRGAKQLLTLLLIAYVSMSPFFCVMGLITLHVGTLVMGSINPVEVDGVYRGVNAIEGVTLLLLSVMFLVADSTSTYLPTKLYLSIGYITLTIILLLILNGLTRIAYLLYRQITHTPAQKAKTATSRTQRAL